MYKKKEKRTSTTVFFVSVNGEREREKVSHTVSQQKLGQEIKLKKKKKEDKEIKSDYSCTFNEIKLLLSSSKRLFRILLIVDDVDGISNEVKYE